MTIILISHFMQEAVSADRVIVLNSGRLAADDTPARIFLQPAQLADWGLEQPPAAAIASQLRLHLPDFPAGILTPRQLCLRPYPTCRMQLLPLLIHHPRLNHPVQPLSRLIPWLTNTCPAPHWPIKPCWMSPAASRKERFCPAGCHRLRQIHPAPAPERFASPAKRPGAGWPFDLTDPKINTRSVVQLAGLVFQNPENQFFEQYVGDEISYGARQFKLDEPLAGARALGNGNGWPGI